MLGTFKFMKLTDGQLIYNKNNRKNMETTLTIERKCILNKDLIIKYKVEKSTIDKYTDLKDILSDEKHTSSIYFTKKHMGIMFVSVDKLKTFDFMVYKIDENELNQMIRSEKIGKIKEQINN